ncbi:MAG: PorT family protein [Flavobacteriales bacterium]|nr:PorT family protein [Flavobacteriales bacterium]
MKNFKKKMLLLAIVATGSLTVSAQGLGVVLGGNSGSIFVKNKSSDITRLNGVFIGPSYQTEHWSTGLYFSQKGYSINNSNNAFVRFNYIDLPLNYKFNFGDKANGFFINYGPTMSFSLGGKLKSGSTSVDIKAGDDMNSTDFGVNLGVGYRFNNFQVGANSYAAVTRWNKGSGDPAYNQLFTLYVGYFKPKD